MTLHIELSPTTNELLNAISRQTGKSADQIVNEAVSQYASASDDNRSDWKEAILQAAGIWKDRVDLPDFDDVRCSMDRELWKR